MHDTPDREVRRPDDGELCGFVRVVGDGYMALTVFHGVLGSFATSHEATRHVLDHGLPSLRLHWHYRASLTDDWELVLIQEARPGWARLVLGYYSLPGVPTTEFIAGADESELRLPPPGVIEAAGP